MNFDRETLYVYLSRMSYGVIVRPSDVVAKILAQGSVIDPRYYVGTALHESNFCLNEWDIETSGFESVGIYQIDQDEARECGYKLRDMLDFDKATKTIIHVAELRRNGLRRAAGIPDGKDDPSDMRAYLALAHNQGYGIALGSVRHFGLDWSAFKSRPENVAAPWGPAMFRYGDDCISGGPNYPPVQLTGEDVMR